MEHVENARRLLALVKLLHHNAKQTEPENLPAQQIVLKDCARLLDGMYQESKDQGLQQMALWVLQTAKHLTGTSSNATPSSS